MHNNLVYNKCVLINKSGINTHLINFVLIDDIVFIVFV